MKRQQKIKGMRELFGVSVPLGYKRGSRRRKKKKKRVGRGRRRRRV